MTLLIKSSNDFLGFISANLSVFLFPIFISRVIIAPQIVSFLWRLRSHRGKFHCWSSMRTRRNCFCSFCRTGLNRYRGSDFLFFSSTSTTSKRLLASPVHQSCCIFSAPSVFRLSQQRDLPSSSQAKHTLNTISLPPIYSPHSTVTLESLISIEELRFHLPAFTPLLQYYYHSYKNMNYQGARHMT